MQTDVGLTFGTSGLNYFEIDDFTGQIGHKGINKHGLLYSKEEPMSERDRFSVFEGAAIQKKSFEERTKDMPEVRAVLSVTTFCTLVDG